ncbi:MAG: terminase small subunit [Candidatus Howiella sp.]
MGRTAKRLTEKERLFCECYADGGSAREAAARAGYVMAQRAGLRLLREKRVQREIAALREARTARSAAEGFRRIAFGSCCDAVRLVLGEEFSSEGLEQLDLFNIAEIKKPKDGSLEIKFFDRIKALENLARMEAERTDPGASVTFYRALEESASVFDEGV